MMHNPLHIEIAKLRERLEYLEAENARLNSLLFGQSAENQIAIISTALDVPPARAALMRTMSDGGIKSIEKLLASYKHRDEENVSVRVIDVHISKIRKQFGKTSIIVHWGFGRSMSPELCERVNAALTGASQ